MRVWRTEIAGLAGGGVLGDEAPAGLEVQFHNALLENGVKSVLVTYPEEGMEYGSFPLRLTMPPGWSAGSRSTWARD